MNVIKTYPEIMDKKTLYSLTRGQSMSVKDVDDRTVITPAAFVVYEDTDKDGKMNEVLAIRDKESGEVFTTISPTFKRDFFDIVDFMGEDDYSIRTVHGTTKAGRDFVTCTMVCD